MAGWQKWQGGEWGSQDNWAWDDDDSKKWDAWRKDENDEKRKKRNDHAAANKEIGASLDAGARPQSSRWKAADCHSSGGQDAKADTDDDNDDDDGQEQIPALNSKWSQWAGKKGQKKDGEKTHRKRDFQSLQRLAGRKVARLEDELKAAKDNAEVLEARMEELKTNMATQQEESAKKVEDMKVELANVTKECEEELRSMRIILGKKSHSEEDMKKNVLTQTELLKSSEDQRVQMQKIMDRQALKIHKHEQALPLWQKKVKQLRKRLDDAEKIINQGRLEKALAEDQSRLTTS